MASEIRVDAQQPVVPSRRSQAARLANSNVGILVVSSRREHHAPGEPAQFIKRALNQGRSRGVVVNRDRAFGGALRIKRGDWVVVAPQHPEAPLREFVQANRAVSFAIALGMRQSLYVGQLLRERQVRIVFLEMRALSSMVSASADPEFALKELSAQYPNVLIVATHRRGGLAAIGDKLFRYTALDSKWVDGRCFTFIGGFLAEFWNTDNVASALRVGFEGRPMATTWSSVEPSPLSPHLEVKTAPSTTRSVSRTGPSFARFAAAAVLLLLIIVILVRFV
jgi:hypothetical protein